MEFRPATPAPAQMVLELWDGPHLAALLYTRKDGFDVVCQPDYERCDLGVQRREPFTLHVGIERQEAEKKL
jgi:hypothetical protein